MPRRKRSKREFEDASPCSGTSTSETDSDSDTRLLAEEEALAFECELDEVVLTAEEEQDFQEVTALYQSYPDREEVLDYKDVIEHTKVRESDDRGIASAESDSEGKSDDSRELHSNYSTSTSTPSPEPKEHRDETKISETRYRVPYGSLPSHNKLLKFLTSARSKAATTVLTSSKNKPEMLATNYWNNSPSEVYSLFNVSRCIVLPNYILASEDDIHGTKVSEVLAEMDRPSVSKDILSWTWRYTKRKLKNFLQVFQGLDDLSNVLHNWEEARPLVRKFNANLSRAYRLDSHWPTYCKFMNVTSSLASSNGEHKESVFLEYVTALLDLLQVITEGCFALRRNELSLVLPVQPYIEEEKVVDVLPDFMVMNDRSIMLVGEVKKIGCKGVGLIKHKGRRVRKVQPDVSDLRPTSQAMETHQPQRQENELLSTVEGTPFLRVTTDDPNASTSKEQTESLTEVSFQRSLDAKERYRVDSYLPQLFGEMLAAMHFNQVNGGESWRYKYCRDNENVQFGFGIEGFKLRFVKLKMVALDKKHHPTVAALLGGKRCKCHISMTQEFNLLKRLHLELFFKVLLAMKYLCRLDV